MVVNHFDDPRETSVPGRVNGEHEPELLVESYRPLAFPITRQLLKVKRFDRIEVNLGLGIRENLHFLNKCAKDIAPQPGMVFAVGKRPFQLHVLKPDLHAGNYTTFSPLG